MRLRIYIDTSVIGGCLDEGFEHASRILIERIIKGHSIAVVSELTTLEMKRAPEEVQSILLKIPSKFIERVALTEEAFTLAKRYISEGVVGKSSLVDAQHIAIATVNRVDVVVSWNFRHIVNLNKIHGFNAVNLKMGYPLMEIRSPWEVVAA
jgi:predicted nucleic acid-binding protein